MVFHRIRELRTNKNLSQETLAQACHVTQNTYSRYETGDISVPIDILIELAHFHDTTVDYIIDFESIPNPKHLTGNKSKHISS